jgi:hypothetical protein
MEEAPLWERSKENAAPLQRGRNVRALEESLAAAESQGDRQEKERMVQHYEHLVQPTEEHYKDGNDSTTSTAEQNDDPLIHWLSYIKFHQEAFPSDTHQEFLLLERCLRALCQTFRYANDVRFVRVCATYASKTDRSAEVFQHLHRQKIGSQTAMFWAAWAWTVEKQEDWQFAEKIYKRGIMKQAQPIQFLRQRHQQFQRRLSRHWLNAGEQLDDEDQDQDNNANNMHQRGRALGALSEDAFRRNDRTTTASTTAAAFPAFPRGRSVPGSTATFVDRSTSRCRLQQEAPPAASNVRSTSATGFAIFVEDTAYDDANDAVLNDSLFDPGELRHLEREQDRKKENTQAAERWNERGGRATPSYLGSSAMSTTRAQLPHSRAPTPPSFAVFVDEACAAENERDEVERQEHSERQRRQLDERRTFRERPDGSGAAERLAKDPLRYMRDPLQLATDLQEEQDGRRSDSTTAAVTRPSKSKKPSGSISCAFNRKLLSKDAAGHEQCFEEARASTRYFKLAPSSLNFNLLDSLQRPSDNMMNDSAMSLDESGSIDIDVSMEDSIADSRLFLSRPASAKTERPLTKPPTTNTRKPLAVRSLFRSDASVEAAVTVPTPRNMSTLSTASSTVDEAVAVGVPGGREEQTINTQFALRELSMMFSSPAFGMNESVRQVNRSGGLGPILNESGVSEAAADDGGGGDDTATFESIADLVQGVADSDHSFRREQSGDSFGSTAGENHGRVGNPHARSNATPDFDALALRTLEADQDQPGCDAAPRRGLGQMSQVDPLRALQEVDLPTDPGFTIYSEEEEPTVFEIYHDSSAVGGGGVTRQREDESEGDTATLSLFGDDVDALTEVAQGGRTDTDSIGSVTLDLNDNVGASRVRKCPNVLRRIAICDALTIVCFASFISGSILNNETATSDPVDFGDISRIEDATGTLPLNVPGAKENQRANRRK